MKTTKKLYATKAEYPKHLFFLLMVFLLLPSAAFSAGYYGEFGAGLGFGSDLAIEFVHLGDRAMALDSEGGDCTTSAATVSYRGSVQYELSNEYDVWFGAGVEVDGISGGLQIRYLAQDKKASVRHQATDELSFSTDVFTLMGVIRYSLLDHYQTFYHPFIHMGIGFAYLTAKGDTVLNGYSLTETGASPTVYDDFENLRNTRFASQIGAGLAIKLSANMEASLLYNFLVTRNFNDFNDMVSYVRESDPVLYDVLGNCCSDGASSPCTEPDLVNVDFKDNGLRARELQIKEHLFELTLRLLI